MGFFIVLEGLDGVGKSTLAKNLALALDAKLMSTPGAEFAAMRGQVLTALQEDQLGKALFYAATVSYQGRQAAEYAKQGTHVVMDRYWASTVAYAKARGVTANLDALTPDLVAPDATLLITVDESQRVARLQQRGTTKEDLETLCPNFKSTVMQALEPRCTLAVDITGLNQAAATSKILNALAPYIHAKTSQSHRPQ